jgi:hypothetical protein
MKITGRVPKATCLLLTLFLIACSGLSSKQKTAANEAVKSLRKIAAATEVGVNYQTYGNMLIETKAVVNDAKEVLPEGELKKEIVAAMDSYQIALEAWKMKITVSTGDFSLIRLPNYEDKIQEHWSNAREHLNSASKLLK